jgi:pimeloyl-ACP methyl ester carboxylesterase
MHDLPGAGAPLIFVHGLGCASSCDYPRVASDPALSGRRMVLVDLLGSGFSDRPPDFDYSIISHARTIADLAVFLATDSIDLYGHSMGGAVAIVAAGMLGKRVRHLILSEPNLDPGGGFFSRKIADMSERDYVAFGHEELIKSSRLDGADVWAASLAASASFAVHRGASSLVLGSKPAWREQLFRLSLPRTVIFGEASLPDPDVQSLPRNGVEISILPQAGHSMAWENPSGLAKVLRELLDGPGQPE